MTENKPCFDCPKCGVIMPIADKKTHVCHPVKKMFKTFEQYEREDKMEEKRVAVKEVALPSLEKTPDIVLRDAKFAAQQLTQIINSKKHPVVINGERYLEYEDWQVLGRFYSLFAKTGEAEYVDIGGVKGFKAQAKVVNAQGVELGSAVAFCLRDEKNWGDKPTFQLASMAQTRAGAKALRNVLAWIVILAGYRPTPAEEITDTNHGMPEEKPKIIKEDLFCAACGRNMSVKEYEFSISKFKKSLCFQCQNKRSSPPAAREKE
jgi:hypothetical protein